MSNADPARLVPISSLAVVARGASRFNRAPEQMAQLLRACGVTPTLDIRVASAGLPSSLVEPPAGAAADALLVLDVVVDQYGTGMPARYALRMRRPDGVTAWRATAEVAPSALATTPVDQLVAAALVDRMAADLVIPVACKQRAA